MDYLIMGCLVMDCLVMDCFVTSREHLKSCFNKSWQSRFTYGCAAVFQYHWLRLVTFFFFKLSPPQKKNITECFPD